MTSVEPDLPLQSVRDLGRMDKGNDRWTANVDLIRLPSLCQLVEGNPNLFFYELLELLPQYQVSGTQASVACSSARAGTEGLGVERDVVVESVHQATSCAGYHDSLSMPLSVKRERCCNR